MLGFLRASAALRPHVTHTMLKPFSAGRIAASIRSLSSKHSRQSTLISSLPRSKITSLPSAFFQSSRFQSSNSASAEPPVLPPRSVGIWLMISSSLVFAIVVVGGVTRLTESGLSITEWKPISGTIPPLTQAQWEEDFNKYKLTPEFKILNHSITLEEYKRIFYMEWAHRVLGRVLGLAFVGPLAYFLVKKRISKPLAIKLAGLALLIGAQGALGWYMVKSGLDHQLMETPGAVPRVSQYRLASHLGLAFILYAGMFFTGISTIKEWKFAVKGSDWMGVAFRDFATLAKSSPFRRFKLQAWALTALVFVTAMSGAFVAGLDAGLLYNEFPYMGETIIPPTGELMAPVYAKNPDKSDMWWRNILENPTTVQFDHRVMAVTTYCAIGALWAQTIWSKSLRQFLPTATRRAAGMAFGMANIQFMLGWATLVYLVPVSLAACHQAGSVMLLTAMIHVLITLRRPGAAAQMWRRVLNDSKIVKGTK